MSEQLADALADSGVSVRELARRLAGGNFPDKQAWEAQRRWVGKVLDGQVKRPTREKVQALEQALALGDGHFVVPTLAQARQDTIGQQETRRRLESLEEAGERLGSQVEELRREVDQIFGRVEALERPARPGSPETGTAAEPTV